MVGFSGYGKLLGAFLGFLLLGVPGLFLGLFIGHQFDRNFQSSFAFSGSQAKAVQQAFFEAVFTCMGHLAKCDGRVTEEEISVARAIMAHLQLSSGQVQEAISLFNRGKSPNFNAAATLDHLKNVSGHRRNLLGMFMQLQFQAAFADGDPNKQEMDILRHFADTLGFSSFEFNRLFAMFKAQQAFGQQYQRAGGQHAGGRHGFGSGNSQQDLQNAYTLLGVKESDDMSTIKRAYRKQMNEYHPDKMVAKGLPESMMKAATEKTRKVQEAYELIKSYRN